MKVNKLDIISDINSLRLYEQVEKEASGGKYIYTIRRVKITQSDSIERIRTLQEKLKSGGIWMKVGRRDEGTIRYRAEGIDTGRILRIILQKKDKTATEGAPSAEIPIDITKENIDEQVEEMTEQDRALLEKIMNTLRESFAGDTNKTSTRSSPVSTPSIANEKNSSVSVSAKLRATRTAGAKPTALTRKQAEKEQEQFIEESREIKREEVKLAKELDEKAEKRKKKDLRSSQNQLEIDAEDIRKKTIKRMKSFEL